MIISLREGRNSNRIISVLTFAEELFSSQKFQEQFQGLKSLSCMYQSIVNVTCCLQSAAVLGDERRCVFGL